MSFSFITANGVDYLTSDALRDAGAIHGFSTRQGGVSQGIFSEMSLSFTRGDAFESVMENHRRFASALDYPLMSLISTRQVHGDEVRIAAEADRGKGLRQELDYECDALITDKPGLPLMILTADCCPILLYDPVRRAAGAVHAGWRGTALGIAGKAVRELVRVYGCRPENILAAIGPCISQCCFETDANVPEAMTVALGDEAEAFIKPRGAKFHVDIKGINRRFLEKEGITQFFVTDECTACNPQRYFSHRVMGENRGSLASVIMIPEADA